MKRLRDNNANFMHFTADIVNVFH